MTVSQTQFLGEGTEASRFSACPSDPGVEHGKPPDNTGSDMDFAAKETDLYCRGSSSRFL